MVFRYKMFMHPNRAKIMGTLLLFGTSLTYSPHQIYDKKEFLSKKEFKFYQIEKVKFGLKL